MDISRLLEGNGSSPAQSTSASCGPANIQPTATSALGGEIESIPTGNGRSAHSQASYQQFQQTYAGFPSTGEPMATLEHPTPAGHFHPLYPAESTNRMRYSDPFPGPQLPAIKRPASAETHPLEPPVKKQSKWSAEENDLIIKLRGDGLKWEEVSRHLPGRSAISCRLHYQNFLERRPLWDEEKKNKLARLYER